ncbi:hypothetical protein CMI37_14545 [Candidatus Pacearchaeota archaeon]|nr:hypothetical protein [Candidatus Pacearchaeota archaeon]
MPLEIRAEHLSHQDLALLAERIWTQWVARPDGCLMMPGRSSNAVSLRGQQWRGHRIIVEYFKGPIPEGFVVDHLCRRPDCVNPFHLEAVPADENLRRVTTSQIQPKSVWWAEAGYEKHPYWPPRRNAKGVTA